MNIDNHYDISKYVFEFIKNDFKYDSNWFYLDKNLNWIHDINYKRLKTFIMTKVVNELINQSIKNIDNDYISSKYIHLSIKLKNHNYIIMIIKELRQFY
jgi:hypothetical protein